MKRPRIAILFPGQPTGNHDCAVGYTKAFRLLGYNTSTLPYHVILTQWREYFRFFGLINGKPDYKPNQEDILRTVGLNIVLRVMELDPDILIVIDGTGIHRTTWEWLRKLGIYTIVVSTECPYQDMFVAHVGEMVDKMFVNDLATAEKTGYEYLPVGYDSEAHHPMLVAEELRHDVVFVGSGFKERREILESINWAGIDFRLYGYYDIDDTHVLAPYYIDQVISNAEAALLYAGSKISLNLNRTSSDYDGKQHVTEARSLSPRAYEIPACGGFMISEHREEIGSIYGDLVPTFSQPDQLEYLIHYWLPRDKERAEIGAQLAKMARSHSYVERAKVIISKLAL
jgi:spore maturation protein CgeB